MDRHAAGRADRLQPPAGRQVALVERMPGLVQHPHQRFGKVALVITGGNADIIGRAARERMSADIEAAMVKVEAQRRHRPEGSAGGGIVAWRSMTASISAGKNPESSPNSRSIVATEPPGS